MTMTAPCLLRYASGIARRGLSYEPVALYQLNPTYTARSPSPLLRPRHSDSALAPSLMFLGHPPTGKACHHAWACAIPTAPLCSGSASQVVTPPKKEEPVSKAVSAEHLDPSSFTDGDHIFAVAI
ncbi:hypothetical protein N7494_002921 [Penicillium frequentans]|uniref:Uncharacterized protein n=1 Tax=Penicillium frequentans TaxID=3151616 RepID=A0AAD6GKE4_9EURO|nr:hypothetical protein N7494_002921 [Penicillium glabrum]